MEGLVMLPDPGFWRSRRVLLTGHTGFKGAWLAIWLHRLGARVTGAALPPPSGPSLFEAASVAELLEHRVCDIRDAAAVRALVRQTRPEIVLHLAAQSLVRVSYAQPLETLATNVMGTANLLDAMRDADGLRVALVVTTDKVYCNREWARPYREDDALGGHDPYSASKAAAELVAASYRDAFLSAQGTAVATARAGNVIGGGDWAQDRLLPDACRAWIQDAVLEVRRPQAVRPWQHVLDPLAGYLRLAHRVWDAPQKAGAYNFGPDAAGAASVAEVVAMARRAFGRGAVRLHTEASGPHEAGLLTLDNTRARTELGVVPRWPLAKAVQRTMSWYRQHADGADARVLCEADLDAYLEHHAATAAA
ncbi:MAG: CDP-glucose 4,6-dehydratase [Rhodoferax sp.]|nr:CDP-glucose 4,6-dehydratase [Rhodoferax sp.]